MSADGRYDLRFSSGRFNLSEPREYFINDCCYGDDVARWLAEQLQLRGLTATGPDQEDWGWYLEVQYGESTYFVGVGGTPDDERQGNNQGEWRLIVEKHRTLWERITKANLFSADDAFLEVLNAIVSNESELVLLGVE